MINIVLVEPQIPPNTGNIGRLCVGSKAHLHIIKPIGFDMTDKYLKRAGMDYWQHLEYSVWDDFASFTKNNPITDRHFFATTKTNTPYFTKKFLSGDFIYFGREDRGLPSLLLEQNSKNSITIPIEENARSLNLANSVAIILYEAMRQNFKYKNRG
jgi:tRNA (cytidine/uridine-2'-O-)-methyltransferase